MQVRSCACSIQRGYVFRSGVAGDEPGLLVAEPSFGERLPQERVAVEAALQRGALGNGALRHSQLLLAIVSEAGEAELVPALRRPKEQHELPEDLVPAPPLLDVSLELPVEPPRVDLAALVGCLPRWGLRQLGPLSMDLLETLLERFEITIRREHQVVDVLVRRRCARAHVLLAPGLDALGIRGRRLF